MKIGIVVGEVSGDILGSALISSLIEIVNNSDLSLNNVEIEGIVGPRLKELGAKELYSMHELAVMGLIEPLAKLPRLFKIQRDIINHFIKNPPDVFIGIDSPDFTLGIEKALKAKGIKTVHYVSPSVWAWRQWRIKKIKKSVDLMLTLLPFEADFYKSNNMNVKYVGHPAADRIPIDIDVSSARSNLDLLPYDKVITVMPGSRNSEIKYLAKTFLQTMKICANQQPNLKFVMPLVKEEHKQVIEKLQGEIAPKLNIKYLLNEADVAIAASNVVLVASGTATLEVMLHKKPMVVAYKLNSLTYFIAKLLVKVRYISLPNILANNGLVPELIQDDATPVRLANQVMSKLSGNNSQLIESFTKIHKSLKQDSSIKAASAVYELVTATS